MADPVRFTDEQYKKIAAENLNQMRPTFDLRRGAVCFHYEKDSQREVIESSLNVIGVPKVQLTSAARNEQGWDFDAPSGDGYSDFSKGSYVAVMGAETWKTLADAGVTFPGHEFMGSPGRKWAKG
jgi:hypothetical protein